MYFTHLAFAFFLSLLVLYFSFPYQLQNPLLFIIVTLFFALLPDIDETKSKLGKKVKPLSFILKILFGHRKLFHSIFVPIIISLLLYLTTNIEIALAAFIGYTSHLILDALTPAGIMPLYPLSQKKTKSFIKTNSFLEHIFFAILSVINVWLVLRIVFYL